MADDVIKQKTNSLRHEIEFDFDDRESLPSCEKILDGEEEGSSQNIEGLLQLWTKYKVLPADDPVVRNVAVELCSQLVKRKNVDALAVFLEALPDTCEYNINESIIRAKIYVSLNKGDTKTVYKLIEENHFTNGEDLIKVWDEARYLDEVERTKKQLTPLSRFRVRKRYPPPSTICKNGVRKTNTLPREATSYLKYWLMNHLNDPYPNANEKQQLAKISGLSHAQVKTWFANARRRSKTTDDIQGRYQNHWAMPLFHSPKEKKGHRSYAGFTGASPIISPPSSPLPLPYTNTTYHTSHINNMYGGGQLSHLDNNQVGISCPDNFQTIPSGYNRNERYGSFSYDYHSYPLCNNVKTCRSLEQSYVDANGRSFVDVESKNHHYGHSSHFYY